VIRCLKNQIPNCDLHYLTKKKFHSLLEHNPHLTKIHLFDDNFISTFQSLRKEDFDVIIDLHYNIRSKLFSMFLNKPTYSFDKENFNKWLYVVTKRDRLPKTHIVDRYMESTKTLGVINDYKGLEFFPCECERLDKTDLPDHFVDSNFIIFSIGGTHFTKRMPTNKWLEILTKVPFPVILIGGMEDLVEGNRIALSPVGKDRIIWNACGKLTIGGSANLIKMSSLVISHDTGMMHIAAAYKKPIISIWGNTSPRFGMFPYLTKNFNLEVNKLNCRPCSKIGFSKCPEGHFNCMIKQDTNNPGMLQFIHQAIS